MKDNDKKRKNLMLLIIGVLTLLIVVAGATYAFFAAQTGDNQTLDVSAKTGTNDSLTFSIVDKDATDEGNHIIDNDPKQGTDDLTPINIKATVENFEANDQSIADGVTAKAVLTANSATRAARETYNVYLRLNTKELEYSSYKNDTGDVKQVPLSDADKGTYNTPVSELILSVKKGTEEYEGVVGLTHKDDIEIKYTEGEEQQTKKISGYDITEVGGLITIASGVPIEVTAPSDPNTQPGPTTDTWEITITFINLPTDQELNTGKQVSGEVIIQKETKQEEIQEKLLADSEANTLLLHNENLTNGANDNSYRYSGASEIVNNYVCLDDVTEVSEEPQQCTTNEDLYRIIGLFKNANQQYEMKLIKAEGATAAQLGNSEVGGGATYSLYSLNNSTNHMYYKGTNWDSLASYSWNSTDKEHILYENSTNVNMWKESDLNSKNLNEYFYNNIDEIYQKKIVSHIWEVGGTSSFNNAKEVYESELGDSKLTKESNLCYTQGNGLALNQEPRLCNSDNDLLFNSNIGLMYISDYMYGTLPEYWNIKASNYNEDVVKNNNWLYLGINEWTLSRWPEYGAGARFIDYAGMTNGIGNDVYNLYCVRPSFYLSSDAKIASGDGTETNPYRIA